MIVSDHNTITGGLEAKEIAEKKYNDSIIIIPAIEYRYGCLFTNCYVDYSSFITHIHLHKLSALVVSI